MIKYRLACKDCETTFDSWFASSKEFEKLKKKHLLICHICNSKTVDKSLMAPSLRNNKKDIKNDLQLDKYENVKKLLKVIKNLLKKILSLLVKILPMKHDPFITILKKNQKVFMEMLPRKISLNLKKKVLMLR